MHITLLSAVFLLNFLSHELLETICKVCQVFQCWTELLGFPACHFGSTIMKPKSLIPILCGYQHSIELYKKLRYTNPCTLAQFYWNSEILFFLRKGYLLLIPCKAFYYPASETAVRTCNLQSTNWRKVGNGNLMIF